MLAFLDSLFKVALELDGSLNKLSSETIQLQYVLAKERKKEMALRKKEMEDK